MPQIFGSAELLADVHKRDLCIGCGACVDLCPYFKNHKGKTSQLFGCTLEQGRCYAYCPKAEVDLDELARRMWRSDYDGSPLGPYRKVLACRAGKRMPRGDFQSGGTVTSLITFAFKKGLIDAAALTDREGLTPVARLATNWEQAAGCASSKFMASPTLAALNMGVREGYRRMGVVGTPCQMTAVAQMQGNPLQKEAYDVPIALTVGLFCNWSVDTRQLMGLLDQRLDGSEIRRMDIPPPPANVMTLETDKGPVTVSLSDIKPLIPRTCFVCLDMTAEFADLAAGMFEGRTGWNTLIVRSEAGEEIVEQARNEGFIETEDFPAENLRHLSKAAADKKERSLRILLRRGLVNNQGDERAAVRIPTEVVDRILGASRE
ncbi:MAG: Coenzyme F420 hydrogenase/dehydrogenase, beta subunit C-terminal domain [Deltaproteobacteria bacterium]|jgi:coenzyme F420 hydrogenase subunit beta|nr:Coenzyme F420 hydrogenase/dehydrogenase, beta subunit C-terminal domain [Deltaproteobacteria bacterium]